MSDLSKMKRYSESDVEGLLKNQRFLAVLYAYSKNLFSVGETVIRARAGDPYVPKALVAIGYRQLIQDVAEKISNGEILVGQEIIDSFPDVYDALERPPTVGIRDVGAAALKFSDLLEFDAKQKAFSLYGDAFSDVDLELIKNDEKILACIDAYGRGIMTFGEAKLRMFGLISYSPFDLSGNAFLQICHHVVKLIKNGQLLIPEDFKTRFPEAYAPREMKA